ncbi:undecaprenyl-diphosphate phosphatase [Natronospirillum operosum]|uniref:Undecaprenyl-diphosphatase n=1 Tax=Natronospirillum operosum TaxID=2759953 RepID=A0A4Z0W651_9GAMM|nr:undecaprenyl-diphosphate phosphatase [Natronospirillum operosum]TGG92705.1 undecaprenyl-diphosphate phosphatase [Natronospirillum operosum]
MAVWIAIALGVVQGVFMFLPVSSTAHLVLTQHWLIQLGYDLPPPESAEMVLFDLVVHVGTLVSILVVFRRSLWKLSLGVLRDTGHWLSDGGRIRRELLFLRLSFLCAFSLLVTAVIGFSFRHWFNLVFANPLSVAGTLTVTGILLWLTDRLSRRPLGLRRINLRIAGIIGLAQGLALIPGLSRSGMTITFALFSGMKRKWAAEYSFFLAIPTILAASAVQSLEVLLDGGLRQLSGTVMAVGFVVAALVGIVALKLVLVLLYRARLKYFSFYLWALAAAVGFGFISPGY